MRKLRILESHWDLGIVEPLWRELAEGDTAATCFQSFAWNAVVARHFGATHALRVVVVESDSGVAIIPAVVGPDGTIDLLGETLFDYRNVLFAGDPACLESAWESLAALRLPLDITAVRRAEGTWPASWLQPFAGAPYVPAAAPRRRHKGLEAAFRQLLAAGCVYGEPQCGATSLRELYVSKAAAECVCLFHDERRIDCLAALAHASPELWQLHTLRHGGTLVAGLVTVLDRGCRRLYGTYYDRAWRQYSPGAALIDHVIAQSLNAGMDVDLMTGEQPFKLRFATEVVPLFRVQAAAADMAAWERSETVAA